MEMTENEICLDYKLAKNQNMQVGILADLNCASRNDILKILMKHGFDVRVKEPPKNQGKYGSRYKYVNSLKKLSSADLLAKCDKYIQFLIIVLEILEERGYDFAKAENRKYAGPLQQ